MPHGPRCEPRRGARGGAAHRLATGRARRRTPGHLWRWELETVDDSRTRVTHTYDWTEPRDAKRMARARATSADKLRASLDRLAALAEDNAS